MQKYSGVRSLVFELLQSQFLGQYCHPTKHDRVKAIHAMNSTMYGLQLLLKEFPCQRSSFLNGSTFGPNLKKKIENSLGMPTNVRTWQKPL